ncbi:anti-sigma-I factor RsgI family protein [Halobacillus litoralis]|uniref:anti-sigma-I factor RsgI family protein n=1 Tax=Halobacillus litoralis TaxID=45668 RepID=UPI0024919375|nr:anti-sigma factor domain-containing protein [Halobacillus litoralis]
MRKGIVMEQQHEYMVVMTNDGRFHRAENLAHAEVGMEVHFKTYSEHKVLRRWTQVLRNNHTKVAVMAIVFLLAFFPVYSWYGSNQAYAYMNIDINPSVELELNDQMQVLNITAQNAEAKEIVSELKGWKKKDASEVTFDVIHLSNEKGYVNSENQVLIGFSYLHSEYDQEYSEEIENYLLEQSTNMTIATFLVPDEIRKQARDQKATVNETLAERLREEQSETGTGSVPVSVEDDDKEIIQSFYNEESSQEDVQEEPGSTITPTVPMKRGEKSPHLKTPVRNKAPDHAELPDKGKKTAPGQKKKEEDASGKARNHDKSKSHQEKAEGHGKKKNVPEKPSKQKSKGSKGVKEKEQSGKHKRKGQQKKSQINKQHDKKDQDRGGPSKGHSSNNGKNNHNHKRE